PEAEHHEAAAGGDDPGDQRCPFHLQLLPSSARRFAMSEALGSKRLPSEPLGSGSTSASLARLAATTLAPCTKTTLPPSQPPTIRTTRPARLSKRPPSVTSPCW